MKIKNISLKLDRVSETSLTSMLVFKEKTGYLDSVQIYNQTGINVTNKCGYELNVVYGP